MNLDEARPLFLERAFEQAPSQTANVAIDRIRQKMGAGKEGVSYEIVWPSSTAPTGALERMASQLVYFLDCRGARLPEAPGVVVSLFVGDTLYFLHARDFVEQLSVCLRLPIADMVTQWGQAAAASP